jgi:hypothetical protein
MFNQNIIVAIKADKKVLRELKDTAYLPFGKEYSILIKNMDSRRAQVRIWIDGTDATEDSFLVVNGNSEVEVERFIKKGNLKEGNKFKFIERTANIEKHRGSKVDDGFIRVEFQFEKIYQPVNTWNHGYTLGGHTTHTFGGDYCGSMTVMTNSTPAYKGTAMRSMNASPTASAATATATANTISTNSVFTAQSAAANPDWLESTPSVAPNDAGITVPGGHSDQTFTTVGWFAVEPQKHVIVLKLLGESPEGKKVAVPVTVKTKPACVTCGKLNKASSKFCGECGTSLTLF